VECVGVWCVSMRRDGVEYRRRESVDDEKERPCLSEESGDRYGICSYEDITPSRACTLRAS
jgi:hypothetical protein